MQVSSYLFEEVTVFDVSCLVRIHCDKYVSEDQPCMHLYPMISLLHTTVVSRVILKLRRADQIKYLYPVRYIKITQGVNVNELFKMLMPRQQSC